ncbi:MAG: peptidyl-prolyl cis-trans isomerase [Victivallales bacterium]|jgi:cyclophilin family peptidyl-prolyl cis-trans isomerase|nr:peptidyl-prolyl cis-trans isomerase [Victivallales bacterium]
MITLKTNKGDIKIKLFEEEAPITTRNFLDYIDSGFYKGTIFHRVIPGFMVQGGGFSEDFNQKPTNEPIKNEADNQLSNKRGTLAMARTNVVDSATAQFFINLVDNDFLDFKAPTPQHFGYCVFGEVTDGMDVVDQIAAVATGSRGMHRDVPTENIVILDAVRD